MKIRKDHLLYSMIIISLLVVFIPAILYSFNGSFTLSDSFWVIGSIAGLLAFVLFFWEYVLSIKPLVSFFTYDVISVINLHRWIGINSLLFFLLHPLALFFDSVLNRNDLLIKIIPSSNYDVQIIYGEIALVVVLVIWLSSYLVRKNIAFKWWKLIHYLTYLVLPITYIHADQIGTMLKSPFIRDYIVFMMIIFVLILVWRILEFAGILSYKYTLTNINYIGKDVIQICLTPDNKFATPNKGQFVDIKTRRFGENHPFSVFYYDENTHEIFFGY